MSPVLEQVPIIMIFTNKINTFCDLTGRDSRIKELLASSAVCSHIPCVTIIPYPTFCQY